MTVDRTIQRSQQFALTIQRSHRFVLCGRHRVNRIACHSSRACRAATAAAIPRAHRRARARARCPCGRLRRAAEIPRPRRGAWRGDARGAIGGGAPAAAGAEPKRRRRRRAAGARRQGSPNGRAHGVRRDARLPGQCGWSAPGTALEAPAGGMLGGGIDECARARSGQPQGPWRATQNKKGGRSNAGQGGGGWTRGIASSVTSFFGAHVHVKASFHRPIQ
eukprot:325803-Chlamydomonas_euryale.AAC.3